MTKSKLRSRCRPYLGTFVGVTLERGSDELFEVAYSQIAHIEKLFNFHDPQSELSQWNQNPTRPMSEEFRELFDLALHLRDISGGSFTPYVEEQAGRERQSDQLDFGGIAKGYAVDRSVDAILKTDPSAQGFVEAGGDIRHFGTSSPVVQLRLGFPPDVFFRSLRLNKPSVATSAPLVAQAYGASKTTLRQGDRPEGTSVTVVAETCALADGLTKAGLFANPETLQKLRASEDVEFFIFDRSGAAIVGFV